LFAATTSDSRLIDKLSADVLTSVPEVCEFVMPILHEWNAPNGVLRTVLIGPVGFDEIYRHLDEVAEAGAFPRAELIDARGTDSRRARAI
jgi:hypothetical protein